MPSKRGKIDRELLLKFFLTFAQFEYALKASNFFKRPRSSSDFSLGPPYAQPDWDRFAVSLRGSFQKEKNIELQEACEYIMEEPPWTQVIINDAVAWECPIRPEQEQDIDLLIRRIRCIRNNLFHGGKFNNDWFEQTERTKRLLECSLIVINECLSLAPAVKEAYDEATI